MSELEAFLETVDELGCAARVRSLAAWITALGPEIEADVGSLGVKFRMGESVLCELAVFGELCMVRVGEPAAVEYRVRDDAVQREALDRVLRGYLAHHAAALP